MSQKSKQRAAWLVLVAVLALIGAAVFVLNGDDDAALGMDYEPTPGYAGLRMQNIFRDDQVTRTVIVTEVEAGGPAATAGLGVADVQDHIVAMDGVPTFTDIDVFSAIQSKRPGEAIVATIERYTWDEDAGRMNPVPEHLTLTMQLAEAPGPDQDGIHDRYTAVDYEDQFRIGIMLQPLTRPAAAYYGIEKPGGVLVANAWPVSWRDRESPQPGDVIVEFDGEQVTGPAKLHELINGVPEDEAIEIKVRRGRLELSYVLPPLGPSVPSANWIPPDARRRVKEALESGHLHPIRIDTSLRLDLRGSVPDRQAGSRIGAIKRLTDSSITIEMYASGVEWTVSVTPETGWAPRPIELIHARPGNLEVGDFVEIHTDDGVTARWILDLSVPIPLQ